jgi:hypothetical protein
MKLKLYLIWLWRYKKLAFNVDVPQFVIDESQRFVDQNNLGMRNDGSDGSKDQQLVGVIGQNMMALALGKRFMQPSTTHDGGVDFEVFGLKLDIKTMGRNSPTKIDYVNNFMASQAKFNVDGYVFASLNKTNNVLTICGWIPKELMMDRASFYKKGDVRIREDQTSFEMKADAYEIRNDQLYYRAKNWAELFVSIHQHSLL